MKKEFRGTAKQITSANVIISVFFEEQTGPNLKRSGKSRSTDPSALRQQKKTLYYLGAADTLVPLSIPSAITGFEQPLLARRKAVMEEKWH